MVRSSINGLLSILPMVVFVLMGLSGYGAEGWVSGFYVGAGLGVVILVSFLFRRQKVDIFLITGVLYLCLGSVFILMGYREGWEFLFDMMAAGFFGMFFLVFLIQVMFGKLLESFVVRESSFPAMALILYLGVVIVSYSLRMHGIWISAVIFILVRWYLLHREKKLVKGKS